MASLEDLTVGTFVRGIHPDAAVTVVSTQWFGSDALELTSKGLCGWVVRPKLTNSSFVEQMDGRRVRAIGDKDLSLRRWPRWEG